MLLDCKCQIGMDLFAHFVIHTLYMAGICIQAKSHLNWLSSISFMPRHCIQHTFNAAWISCTNRPITLPIIPASQLHYTLKFAPLFTFFPSSMRTSNRKACCVFLQYSQINYLGINLFAFYRTANWYFSFFFCHTTHFLHLTSIHYCWAFPFGLRTLFYSTLFALKKYKHELNSSPW